MTTPPGRALLCASLAEAMSLTEHRAVVVSRYKISQASHPTTANQNSRRLFSPLLQETIHIYIINLNFSIWKTGLIVSSSRNGLKNHKHKITTITNICLELPLFRDPLFICNVTILLTTRSIIPFKSKTRRHGENG